MSGCVLLFLMCVSSIGQKYDDISNLLEYLFNETRYNKFIRPIQNQTQVLQVNFTQFLSGIENLDITSGELTTNGFFQILWRDEFLTWDPSHYGGKTMVPLPTSKYWKPEITSYGAFSDDSRIDGANFSPAYATYEGLIMMIPASSYKTRCEIDTAFYPFDQHNCSFSFLLANHPVNEITLHSPLDYIVNVLHSQNGEWDIGTTSIYTKTEKIEGYDVSVSMVISSLIIKRRPTFEIINNILPQTLMGFLNVMVCFIRPDSGERLAFSVTLYLAIVFVSTASMERMPHNSLNLPVASYVTLLFHFFNTTGVVWSIYIVYIVKTPLECLKVPNVILKWTDKCKKERKKTRSIQPTVLPVEGHMDDRSNGSITLADGFDIDSSDVANYLDRLFFIVFMTVWVFVFGTGCLVIMVSYYG